MKYQALTILCLIRNKKQTNINELIKEIKLSRRSIQRYLVDLEAFELIEYTRGYQAGCNTIHGVIKYKDRV